MTRQSVICPAEPTLHPLEDMIAWVEEDLLAFYPDAEERAAKRPIVSSFLNEYDFSENYQKLVQRKGEVEGGRLYLNHSLVTLNYVVTLIPDPGKPQMLVRAASLVAATIEFQQQFLNQTLEPEVRRGRSLCMQQFSNIFGRTLVPSPEGGNQYRDCPNSLHIGVLYRGHAYQVPVFQNGKPMSVGQILHQLEWVTTQSSEQEGNLGLITCGTRPECGQWRARLAQESEGQDLLEAMDSALFILALDEEQSPRSCEDLGRAVFSQNPANRWHDKSIQWVVCGNGQAGLVCNYACYLDGSVGIHFASRVCALASTIKGGGLDEVEVTPRFFVQQLPDEIRAAAHTAGHYLLREEQSVFEAEGFARRFFKAHRISPDSCVQMAILIGTYRMFGKVLSLRQYVSLRHFIGGTLDLPYVSTKEVIAFIDAATRGNVAPKALCSLLRAAVASHKKLILQTYKGRSPKLVFNCVPWDESLERVNFLQQRLTYYKEQGIRNYVGDMFGLTEDTADLITSALQLYPETPLAGRPGIRLPYLTYLGMHYFVTDESILFSYMPAPQCPNDLRELHEHIEQALRLIGDILAAE